MDYLEEEEQQRRSYSTLSTSADASPARQRRLSHQGYTPSKSPTKPAKKRKRGETAADYPAWVAPPAHEVAMLLNMGYHPEVKTRTVSQLTRTCKIGSTLALMNGMAGGTLEGERVGRQVHWLSLELTGWLYPIGSSATSALVSVGVIYDRQPSSAQPVVTDVFTTDHAASFTNTNYEDRFEILVRRRVALGPQIVDVTADKSYGIADSVSTCFHVYKKLDLYTVYNGIGDTIAAISSGGLFLFSLGDSAAGVNNATLNYSYRLRYSDE